MVNAYQRWNAMLNIKSIRILFMEDRHFIMEHCFVRLEAYIICDRWACPHKEKETCKGPSTFYEQPAKKSLQ